MIAATVCQWYFTGQGEAMSDSPYETSVWRSFKWGAWYHLGSVAFGAFIIAVVTIIRIIFEYMAAKYEAVGNKENPIYKAVKCYIRYVLWCLDKYVKFITKNAFIQIVLSNVNFCSACWTSFYLIVRHAGRFTSAAMIGWIMMMLGKGTIMGCTAYLTYLLCTSIEPAKTKVKQPFLPAVLLAVVAYFVASLFLSIFSFACTAILHCFILDEDTGGSEMTPKALQPFLDMNDARVKQQESFKKIDDTDGGKKNSGTDNKANNME